MIKIYLETLTVLLTDIKQGIESEHALYNNACINKIGQLRVSFVCKQKTHKELYILFGDLYEKVNLYFKDKTSEIRKNYVNDLFQQVRSKLMELILFDSESGLKL